MPEIYAGAGSARVRLDLSAPFAQGAAGQICRVNGRPGVVAKLYLPTADIQGYARKIPMMLARVPNLPDIEEGGDRCVQLAWPLDQLTDAAGNFRGFLMPEVDFKGSAMLEDVLLKATRQADGIAEFYGYRVVLAANLASVIAELHALGHYMIDMKPENMRFYPRHWYMAIVDTDGFSVQGDAGRVPSDQYSENYIAPEAKAKRPGELGEAQDLFALAVILFRLLNSGIHPYQGVGKPGASLPSDLQSRIFAGLYAYGVKPHPRVSPSPSSLHTWFEDGTRALFDRAFGDPARRPTAAEWRDHLRGLVQNKVLAPCQKKPKEHGQFSKGCGQCAIEQRQAAAPPPPPRRSGPLQMSPGQMSPATSPVFRRAGAPSPPPVFRPAAGGGGGLRPLARPFGRLARPAAGGKSRAGGFWSWVAALGLVAIVLTNVTSCLARRAPSPPEPAQVSRFGALTYRVTPGPGIDAALMRAGPGPTYKAVGELEAGTTFIASGRTTDSDGRVWLLVSQPGGGTAYVWESLATPVQETKASFDCTTAATWLETTICGDPDLAKADLDLHDVYQARLEALGSGPPAYRLGRQQAAWEAKREQCQAQPNPAACLKDLYLTRTAELRAAEAKGKAKR